MRLRIIDWNSRWFWFTVFFRKSWSGCVGYHLDVNLYGPQTWTKPWFNFWMWEELPDMRPQVVIDPGGLPHGMDQ